jgi:hypothetical protein
MNYPAASRLRGILTGTQQKYYEASLKELDPEKRLNFYSNIAPLRRHK